MTTRRITTWLLAAVLAGTGLLLVPPVASQAAPSEEVAATSAGPTAQRAKEPLTRWRCGAWHNHGGIGWRDCAKLSSFDDKVKIDYRERFYNGTNRRGSVQCSHSETTSWSFGATVSLESEAGAIFAKVKASVSASVERSTSTTRTAGVSFSHPAHSWVHCERGIHGYTFRGVVRRTTCDSQGCVRSGLKGFSGSAPEAGFWRYGDGRGGVEITP